MLCINPYHAELEYFAKGVCVLWQQFCPYGIPMVTNLCGGGLQALFAIIR